MPGVSLVFKLRVQIVDQDYGGSGRRVGLPLKTIRVDIGRQRRRIRHRAPGARDVEHGDALLLALIQQHEIVLGEAGYRTVLVPNDHVYLDQMCGDADCGLLRPSERHKRPDYADPPHRPVHHHTNGYYPLTPELSSDP